MTSIVDLDDLDASEVSAAQDAGKLTKKGNSICGNPPGGDWDMGDPEETCRALGIADDDRLKHRPKPKDNE